MSTVFARDEVESIIHSDDAFAAVAYLNIRRAHLEDKKVLGTE